MFASRRGRAFALYVMNPDGSQARPITNPPEPYFDGRPNVSRDGRKIVFNRESGDTIGIFTVAIPGRG